MSNCSDADLEKFIKLGWKVSLTPCDSYDFDIFRLEP